MHNAFTSPMIIPGFSLVSSLLGKDSFELCNRVSPPASLLSNASLSAGNLSHAVTGLGVFIAMGAMAYFRGLFGEGA